MIRSANTPNMSPISQPLNRYPERSARQEYGYLTGHQFARAIWRKLLHLES